MIPVATLRCLFGCLEVFVAVIVAFFSFCSFVLLFSALYASICLYEDRASGVPLPLPSPLSLTKKDNEKTKTYRNTEETEHRERNKTKWKDNKREEEKDRELFFSSNSLDIWLFFPAKGGKAERWARRGACSCRGRVSVSARRRRRCWRRRQMALVSSSGTDHPPDTYFKFPRFSAYFRVHFFFFFFRRMRKKS